MKIVAANPGQVAVFFPAAKETSGFRFHLHAPFVPELSRASIKDTPANDPLFQQLANLTAASLHTIRDLGLLTADFLSVLPNPEDDLPKRYDGIRSAIVAEMNDQPLTPTHAKSHAPAKYLLQAKPSLKDLLSDADIEFLVDYEESPPLWAVGAPQKFLRGLAIKLWDTEQFVELLCNMTSTLSQDSGSAAKITPEEVMAWLKKKSAEWHQQLYALLSTENLSSMRYPHSPVLERLKSLRIIQLKSLRIIRLSDGNYRDANSKCFFPSEGVEHDEEMPRVAKSVYTSGANEEEQKAARKFLVDVGVRVVGEAEQVEVILQRRYRREGCKPDKQDLERFIALVEKEPQKANLFAEYFIFEGKDGKWRKPSQVFLDAPFLDTALSAYFEALGDGAQKMALSDSYRDDSILVERLQKFAVAVGVQNALCVTPSYCRSNPCWKELRSGDRPKANNDSYGCINYDFDIEEFQRLTALQTVAASRLIWITMMKVGPDQLIAQYRRNNDSDLRTSPSLFIHRLINAAWVPQGDAPFVRPAEASRDLLPDYFEFAASWKWLTAIRFGEAARQKSEEPPETQDARQQEKHDAAKALGIAEDSIQDAQWFAALAHEERQRFRQEHERKQNVDLPEHEPKNPGRRKQHVAAEAEEAPDRSTESRTRAVSVGREKVMAEAAQYLSHQYTNDSGQMICQVCQGELPFKLDDETYYFEKVEFLSEDELPKRHYQNYIALCPNHSAMFQHANGVRERLLELFETMEGNDLKVVLGQRDHTIYFTKTHRQDLLTVIESSRAVIPTASDS